MNILVVEDDKRLAEALRFLLERDGYRVDLVYDGNDALSYATSSRHYDLFIFDIMLPSVNGLEILSHIRAQGENTPVLMLTALSQTADKVLGLDSGADDYLTKPFQSAELLARVRALTRRTGTVVLDLLEFSDLVLDITTHTLSHKKSGEEQSIHLSEKEFEVLSLLMRHAGQVISKEQIISQAWGFDSYVEDNNVEAYISFLRKKISRLKSKAAIDTIRGLGYILVDTPHSDE